MSQVKAATYADRDKTAALLEQIRSERPEHWPHGLSPQMFDPGDLYLIRKQATEDPVGFVGWQEREMGAERVGLYSIGVLPQWRHQGIAKVAVAKLLADKARGVDRVAALVVDGNVPSEKLAESLGVPLLKKQAGPVAAVKAFFKLRGVGPAGEKVLRWPAHVGAGAANATIWDYGLSPDREEGTLKPFSGDWNAKRIVNTALNFGLGAGAVSQRNRANLARHEQSLVPAKVTRANTAARSEIGKEIHHYDRSAGAALGAAPLKDMLIYGTGATKGLRDLPDAVKALGDKFTEGTKSVATPVVEAAKSMPTWAALAGAGILTTGLVASAYGIQKAIRDKAEAPVNIQTSQGGRLKVTLPTTRAGDSETVLDLPFDQENALSKSLRDNLKRDTRRRLFAETKARVRHRTAGKQVSEKHEPYAVS